VVDRRRVDARLDQNFAVEVGMHGFGTSVLLLGKGLRRKGGGDPAGSAPDPELERAYVRVLFSVTIIDSVFEPFSRAIAAGQYGWPPTRRMKRNAVWSLSKYR